MNTLQRVALFLVLLMAGGALACNKTLGEEYLFPDEDETKTAVVNAFLARYDARPPEETFRGAHAKHHGCTKATFTIADDVPEQAQHGIFAQAGSYETWIRHSNSQGTTPSKDSKANEARGLAMKLMDVEGDKLLTQEQHTQDFIFISSTENTFFLEKASDYLDFLSDPDFFAKNPLSVPPAVAAAGEGTSTGNLLDMSYMSMVPYKLGPWAVKYSLHPCSDSKSAFNATEGDDYLRSNLAHHLDPHSTTGKEGCFDFQVQIQTDACTMPVEDARVLWNITESPPVTVGRLIIHKQIFANANQDAMCENFAYNPWHGIEAHQPLGSHSRVRKILYEQGSEKRWENNAQGNVHIEPTAGSAQAMCPVKFTAPCQVDAEGSGSGSTDISGAEDLSSLPIHLVFAGLLSVSVFALSMMFYK